MVSVLWCACSSFAVVYGGNAAIAKRNATLTRSVLGLQSPILNAVDPDEQFWDDERTEFEIDAAGRPPFMLAVLPCFHCCNASI